jgi:hypothetical protein
MQVSLDGCNRMQVFRINLIFEVLINFVGLVCSISLAVLLAK